MTNNESHDDNTQSFVPLTVATEVGHYKIIEKIGAGGMGEVFLAEDTKLKRNVALKFLPMQYMNDANLRERFTREARAVAALSHPNIVTIHEVDEFNGRPFFAMEHIPGESLKDVIKKNKLSTTEAISYGMQICEGLQKAHDAGIIHRDIKPGNIIIGSDGRARILDFGLAMVAGEEKLTKTGSTLGTVGYMAPEQIEGKKVDHRSDLFSVGVILYEMVTGRRPFEGDNDAAIVKAITSSSPEPIARFKSGVTGELQRIIDKALSKDVSIRYQHADGMHADLKRLQSDAVPHGKGRLGLWVGAAVIVIIGGYFGYTYIVKEKPKPKGPKRLVVLPFDNVGGEDQDYFASGVTDEVISRLASISGLSVVSRMSAAKMKEAGEDIKSIGKELNAEYVLDASARYQLGSDGSRHVRLTTQLINVTEDRIVWSETYDTVMTEVFAVQANIAEKVAQQMDVVLLNPERKEIWERATESEEAYDYFLRGNRFFYQGVYGVKKYLRLALDMYYEAVKLDSSFSRAYSKMSRAYSRLYSYYRDRNDSIRVLVKTTVEKALHFSSKEYDEFNTHLSLASYYWRVENDCEKSLNEYNIAFKDRKVSYNYMWYVHPIYRDMGNWDRAYELVKRASELEPLVANLKYDVAVICEQMHKYDEAAGYFEGASRLRPDFINSYYRYAWMCFRWQAGTKKSRKVIEQSWNKVDTTRWTGSLIRLDLYDGDLATGRNRLESATFGKITYWFYLAWIYETENKMDSAHIFLDSLLPLDKKYVEENPDYPPAYSYLGLTYARLGNREMAFENIRKALELWPLSKNPNRGPQILGTLMDIYNVLGELDSTLIVAEQLLKIPCETDLGLFLIDPDYRELIRHPGFARLVREYGNEYHKKVYEEKVGAL